MLRSLLVAAISLTICLPLFAQDRMDKGLDVSIGMFSLSDGNSDHWIGKGVGINVEKKVSSLAGGGLYASVGCIKFSQGTQLSDYQRFTSDALLFPMMLTVRSDIRAERSNRPKAYYGLGIGAVLTAAHGRLVKSLTPELTLSADTTEVKLAWQLVGGMKLGRNILAEAKYLNGGSEYTTGIWLSVGSRF